MSTCTGCDTTVINGECDCTRNDPWGGLEGWDALEAEWDVWEASQNDDVVYGVHGTCRPLA